MSIKIQSVSDYSSQDKKYPASNLLKNYTWKCEYWHDYAWIILELKDDAIIESFDICNHSSAFIELFVSSSSFPNDFKVMLPVFSAMSVKDSANKKDYKKVFSFKPKCFTLATIQKPWRYVKCVCSQPFNKLINFGLSNITIYGQKFEQKLLSTDKISNQLLLEINNKEQMSVNYFEKFNLKQKKELILVSDEKKLSSCSLNKENENKMNENDETKIELNNPEKNKTNSQLLKKENNKKLKKEKSLDLNCSKVKNTVGQNPNLPSTSSSCLPIKISSKKVKSKSKSEKSFDSQMSHVVFVMSGYENPFRSEFRDKAVSMGAKYSSNWDANCTHLICAFSNTPKYNQVKRLNGRIVSEKWIEDSYSQKKLLEWRNYMVGKYNGPDTPQHSENEEEMSIEENGQYDSDVIYDLDTDDDN